MRNLRPHVPYTYLIDLDNCLLTRRWHFDWDLFLRRGDKISIAHNRNFERLDLPFEIVPGVIVPAGDYNFDEINLELVSDLSRPVNAGINYTFGGFFNGTRTVVRLYAGFRLGARFCTALSLIRNDVNLPAGDFVTNLALARITYDFSTRLFLDGLIQYDNQTDQVVSNIRMNFIHTPGADLFIVYNERRLTEQAELVERAVIVKLTHLLRF